MIRLLSVNVGRPRDIAWRGKIVYTSVWKEPVAGGAFTTVLRAPQNVAEYPSVKVVAVFSKFDKKTLEFMAGAVRDGKLVIPISLKLPLSEAAEAQAAAEKGRVENILLVARQCFANKGHVFIVSSLSKGFIDEDGTNRAEEL